jgi:2-methylcitrate dehydratase PrpD
VAAQNTFKPYPCGFLLHPTLDACLGLTDDAIQASDGFDRITVTVHPLSQIRADRPHPVDGLESKLSLQHAVAMAMMRRDAGVRAFTDAAVNDLAVQACRQKVKIVADERLNTAEARVLIHLQNGRCMTLETSGAQAPMTCAALERKFRELVAYGAPHCNADELLQALARFPQMANAADLIAMTVPPS